MTNLVYSTLGQYSVEFSERKGLACIGDGWRKGGGGWTWGGGEECVIWNLRQMNKYIYSLSTLRLLRHIEIELYRQEGGGGGNFV